MQLKTMTCLERDAIVDNEKDYTFITYDYADYLNIQKSLGNATYWIETTDGDFESMTYVWEGVY